MDEKIWEMTMVERFDLSEEIWGHLSAFSILPGYTGTLV